VLRQSNMVVRNALIVWVDEQRDATAAGVAACQFAR